jgi:hypothetical protein
MLRFSCVAAALLLLLVDNGHGTTTTPKTTTTIAATTPTQQQVVRRSGGVVVEETVTSIGPCPKQGSNMSVMRDYAKRMFDFSFNGYMQHAFPLDELDPVHCVGRGVYDARFLMEQNLALEAAIGSHDADLKPGYVRDPNICLPGASFSHRYFIVWRRNTAGTQTQPTLM